MRLVSLRLRRRRAGGDGRRPDPVDREGAAPAPGCPSTTSACSSSTRRSPCRCWPSSTTSASPTTTRGSTRGAARSPSATRWPSSGVRLMTQLARQFAEHPEVRYGLTAMCIGIGMGGTVIWENPTLGRRARSDRDRAGSSPDEVVTKALLRLRRRARAGPAGRADHAGQRVRPHASRTRFGPGGLASLDAAIDDGALAARAGVHRGHRQAVHLLRRRRPDRHAADRRPRAGAGDRPARATGSSPARASSRGADVRVRQRRGAWAAASSWRCTATTAPSVAAAAGAGAARGAPSAWCRAGAAPSCCPT